MAQKKRVLIISYYFAPQNLIGAVRPTKLAKYLTRMGCEVTVLCGGGRDGRVDPTLERDLRELPDVHRLTEWNPLRDWKRRRGDAPAAVRDTSEPEKMSLPRYVAFRLVDGAYVALRWLADRSFSRLGRRELRRMQGPYDMVFSTYAPFSVHEIARKARKSGLARYWVADFRDEVGMPFSFQEGRRKRYLQMLRRDADRLCAVSRGFLDMMDFQGEVLSNGFDREDIREIPAQGEDGRLRVVYCGQMLDSRRELGRRDITPMFRALGRLVEEGTLRRDDLRLVYAGREGGIFAEYAASCGLADCVEDHGQVSREVSIALQKGADILLMGAHYLASQRGILTGKLFEYMMMDKPIVCCMAGDLPGSGVKRVLTETGMGFCREEAAAAQDDPALLRYVRGLVRARQRKEPLLEGKNDVVVESYGYPRLAGQLAAWMTGEKE